LEQAYAGPASRRILDLLALSDDASLGLIHDQR